MGHILASTRLVGGGNAEGHQKEAWAPELGTRDDPVLPRTLLVTAGHTAPRDQSPCLNTPVPPTTLWKYTGPLSTARGHSDEMLRFSLRSLRLQFCLPTSEVRWKRRDVSTACSQVCVHTHGILHAENCHFVIDSCNRFVCIHRVTEFYLWMRT